MIATRSGIPRDPAKHLVAAIKQVLNEAVARSLAWQAGDDASAAPCARTGMSRRRAAGGELEAAAAVEAPWVGESGEVNDDSWQVASQIRQAREAPRRQA